VSTDPVDAGYCCGRPEISLLGAARQSTHLKECRRDLEGRQAWQGWAGDGLEVSEKSGFGWVTARLHSGRSYPVDEIPTVVPLLKTELTFDRGKVGVGSSFESEWRLMLVQNDYQTVNGHWAESKTGWLESWRNNQTCHVCRH
jgi:hypothetical protein